MSYGLQISLHGTTLGQFFRKMFSQFKKDPKKSQVKKLRKKILKNSRNKQEINLQTNIR